MMIISTPNKKSIISLFNDQLIRDSTGVIITIFFILYSFASFVWQALLSNQLTNIGAIYTRKNRLRLTELGCFLNKEQTSGTNGTKKSVK